MSKKTTFNFADVVNEITRRKDTLQDRKLDNIRGKVDDPSDGEQNVSEKESVILPVITTIEEEGEEAEVCQEKEAEMVQCSSEGNNNDLQKINRQPATSVRADIKASPSTTLDNKFSQQGENLKPNLEEIQKSNVNKIRIPDKFISQEKSSKDIKNLINTSNKNTSTSFPLNYLELVPRIKYIADTEFKEALHHEDITNTGVCEKSIQTDLLGCKQSKKKIDSGKPEPVSNRWSYKGNVKKLMEAYQCTGAKSTLRNLHKKIKPIPREIYTESEMKKPKEIAVLLRNDSEPTSSIYASPICTHHIGNEVGYNKMSVAEKRKVCVCDFLLADCN